MTGCDWIICERTGRWASGLRVALERSGMPGDRAARLYEVRSLRDLAARLILRPGALVAIEVDRANFADVLFWLAGAVQRFPHARFAAMLDQSLTENQETDAGGDEARDVEHALVEAGVALVVRSPRRCSALVGLARRHVAARALERAAARDDLSPTERVWASLPWQGQ